MPYSPSLATLEKDCGPNQERESCFFPQPSATPSRLRRAISLAVVQETRPFPWMRPGCPGHTLGQLLGPGGDPCTCSGQGATPGGLRFPRGDGWGCPSLGLAGNERTPAGGGDKRGGGGAMGTGADCGSPRRGGALAARCWAQCPLVWGIKEQQRGRGRWGRVSARR